MQPNKAILELMLESYFLISSMFKGLEMNIIFIPGESYEVIEYMMANDLIKNFKINSFNVDLLPIDNDLLSLEKENCFREIYIDKNLTSISELANAFVKLEACFGKVKHRYVKGDNAKIFNELVKQKEKENDLKTTEEILGMITLDRSVDFITTVTSNYTYEGLIDDNFGINFGTIKIKESYIKEILSKIKAKNPSSSNADKIVTYGLTSYLNPFYCRLGLMNYIDASQYINQLDNYYVNIAEKANNPGKNTSFKDLNSMANELKTYFAEIKESLFANKNIMNHIISNFTEERKNYTKNEQLLLAADLPKNLHLYYEDYICDKKDLHEILKLMVVESLTQGGISNYNSLKRDILNIYGYQNIFLFRDLENLGWLRGKAYIKNLIDMSYDEICEKLELVEKEASDKKIDNTYYVMMGFCPLGLKLIEKAIEGKWNKIQDILKNIPGETSFPLNEIEITKPNKEINTIFLVFIGGITYTEISGIRFLNRKFKEAYEKSTSKKPTRTQLIIVTTGILSRKKLFSTLGKDFKNLYSMKQFYEQTKVPQKK